MPSALTYPGVYVEEIPSGVRTIVGVATSITAFIGRAPRGPIDDPRTINGFGDFERIYGGLWGKSSLGFAVRDFFLNGGSQAVVVRVHEGAKKTRLTLPDAFKLEAAYEGAWGNELRARVDHDVSEDVAKSYGLAKADLFNLTLQDTATGVQEIFRNVTVAESPAKVDRALENGSVLARVVMPLPPGVPKESDADLEAKALDADDAVSKPAKAALAKPPFGSDDDPRSVGLAADADKGSDGDPLVQDSFIGAGFENGKQGLYALAKVDLFNLLCIPGYTATDDVDPSLVTVAAQYCERRRAMLLVDPPSAWSTKDEARDGVTSVGTSSKNAALFFPRLRQPHPLRGGQLADFVPCGAVAGIFARTDTQRGVWKAPAGLEATLVGVPELSVLINDQENGQLNPLGVNCLRDRPPAGRVIWGARTLQGNDQLASEWKYIPVRRLALYIEESLFRGTQWVVFEPNDEPLWAQIRLNLGAFMHDLFVQGAFQGNTPAKAYFVKCDSQTTTQNDIDRGVVNILIGFAPLKPAEFVVIKLQQIAGQIQT
ncbi:phage tail sheath subtilisin-like domain-containing protein [Streptomyces durmitorensis]|uniref:Phage tail sheath subtilisin-like domain-containing protein n=1 Tax=Streptomyces durmitorensis TaxID=319947 RepID=A0ABY4Q637_9ACTN|nr:phage tail sheath subtilisin-like domain-containing protein [Streptomyces durmitorensis]UQT60693.1 phage tail sheath subtilisin-like domain-containing protein [Streptomyces durmitorensis]